MELINNNFKVKTCILLIQTLLTGLLAGVFFTWTNAITPGIGRLDDINYLQAFQHMNRTILNPLFYIVIMGPVLLSIPAIYFYNSNLKIISNITLSSVAIYFVGVFLVTLLGNLPLNDLLEKTNLSTISLADAKILRENFESKWNNLHLIRSISSGISFLLLILSCLFSNVNIKNN